MTNRLPSLLALLLAFGMNTPLCGQSYNFYFGDLHSHTWYSDGNQDQTPATYTLPVARAMTYAKSSPYMNFLGVSDHNHVDGGFPMTLNLWRSGFREIDSVNQDGTFAAMYGQEWGVISGGGHVLIYGTDKLFGWNPGVYDVFVTKSNYAMLFDSVKQYGGFCYLAHPQSTDYGGMFSGPYNATWDSVVVGVAMRNGPATSTVTNESNPSTAVYEPRYHDLLRLGYHVAPCANQDNHNTTYGRVNQQRTVVLATSLTRANVLDALRNRRAYATEDHNLQLRFEVGTHQMGEMITQSGPVPIRVKVVDPDGSNLISTIELRYGVPGSGDAPTVLSSVTNQDSLVISQSQAIGTTYYYYAYVRETNGSQAWSAPIWITIPTGPLPGAFSQSAPPNMSVNLPVSGTLNWEASTNASQYDVYLDLNNPPVTLVSANQSATSYSYSGLLNNRQYRWQVIAKNANGTALAGGAPWNFTTIVATPGAFIHLAPGNTFSNQPTSGTLSWESSANAAAYDVYVDTNSTPAAIVSANQSGTSFEYNGLLNGKIYYWKIVAKNTAGSLSATSAPWMFTTIGQSPGGFSLYLPPDNSSSQPLEGGLVWAASADAASYDVYLDLNDPPAAMVDSNMADTTYGYGGLLPGRSYHWKIIARNVNGFTLASNAPRSFSTVNVPAAASNISASNVGPNSLQLSWIDNAADETGYRLFRSVSAGGPFVQVGNDLPANAISFTDSGLSINQRYYYRVFPFSTIGEGNFAPVNVATLAVVPGVPAVSSPDYASVTVTIDPSANPASTEFAIRSDIDASQAYVQSNGSLAASPVWRTFAEWGGGSGTVVQGLHACRASTFDVIARNLDSVETSAGAGAGRLLPCFSTQQQAMSGWNLFSMPVVVPDPRRPIVFPSSASDAFFYQGSYIRRDTLRYGSGFWIKYHSAATFNLQGEPHLSDTIGLDIGWNLIGSLAYPIPVNAVTEQPGSMVVSRYYGYNGAYIEADSLRPMRGYWVKANMPGNLILVSSMIAPAKPSLHGLEDETESLNSLTFEDRMGHRQTLLFGAIAPAQQRSPEYELPPVPPAGAFDVRFGDSRSIARVALDENQPIQRIPVLLQAISYPVRITAKIPGEAAFRASLSDEVGTIPIAEDRPIELQQTRGSLMLVVQSVSTNELPKATVMHQNYPNPFNPSTEIRYDLASPGRVRVSILNLLGQTVATIVDGQQAAGFHHTTWHPEVAGGIYFVKLELIPHDISASHFVQIKKLIYLK